MSVEKEVKESERTPYDNVSNVFSHESHIQPIQSLDMSDESSTDDPKHNDTTIVTEATT